MKSLTVTQLARNCRSVIQFSQLLLQMAEEKDVLRPQIKKRYYRLLHMWDFITFFLIDLVKILQSTTERRPLPAAT